MVRVPFIGEVSFSRKPVQESHADTLLRTFNEFLDSGRASSSERSEVQRAIESIQQTTNYVDPFEPFRENGEWWSAVGSGSGPTSSTDHSNFRNEMELEYARNYSRWLAASNPFCQNAIENRISYLVGTGHTYTVVARKGEEVADDEKKLIQDELDEFLYESDWRTRQEETVRRLDRDGECFRKFTVVDGEQGKRLRVRFIEPNQVRRPEHSQEEADDFGIQTDAEDVETVLGYWVDDELDDDVESIQHIKWNVDKTVKRGRPTYYSVRELLRHAMTLLNNIAVTSTIQTAIAIVVRHGGATKAGLESKRSGAADVVRTNTSTGNRDYYERRKPGQVIRTNDQTEYDFPASGIRVSEYERGLQAVLRGVASRVVMPEFMLTSDASNANYASTMVSEGPAVKMFLRLQGELKEDDEEVMWKVVELGAASRRVPAELVEKIEIEIGAPTVEVRNAKEEADELEVLQRLGVISKQTICARKNLDYEQEMKNIQEHREQYGENEPAGFSDPFSPDRQQPDADEHELRKANVTARQEAWVGYPV